VVPVPDGPAMQFKLDEPHELVFGWWEFVVTGGGGPTANTRTVLAHATLAQAGRRVLLKAEDSVRPALAAGWRKTPPNSAAHAARLWAGDLVVLVEAIRAQARGV
jgi:hypothetical protein